jgi:integrase
MTENNRIRIGDRVTIFARGKNKIYCADFWNEGKHQRVSLKTRNQKTAVQRAVNLDRDLTTGTFSRAPAPMPIREAIEKYLSYLEIEGKAASTIKRYRGELHGFRDFQEEHHAGLLTKITPALFDEFRALRKKGTTTKKPIEASTLNHEGVVIKQFLKWCRSRKFVMQHPLEDYDLEKPKREPKAGPSLDQVNQILAACKEPQGTVLTQLAFTGCRSGSAQQCRPEDLDLAGNWLHIRSRPGARTKSGRSYKVPIHPRLRPCLERLPNRARPWLYTEPPSREFPNGDHRINTKRLNEYFLKVAGDLGMPVGRKSGFTVHSLRHFFETFCVNSGIPQRVVDAWLDHRSDRSMASVYYKLSDEDSQSFMKKVPFWTGLPAAEAGDIGGQSCTT